MITLTKIKICGLMREEDILAVNSYCPEYIGFVFAESKRRITDEKAAALKKLLLPKIQAVGVFVNEPMEHIIELCRYKVIDFIQLHGEEELDYIKKLQKEVKNPIIKAVRVQNIQQILDAVKLPVKYLLFDTYVKNSYGGSGKTFDKSKIKEAYGQIESEKRKPFFIAGGLKKENILETIKACKPEAIDISSGVETEDKKDKDKIAEVIQLVRK